MTINLSCAECKAVTSFSGTPPACDVCGWVCTPDSMAAVDTPRQTPAPSSKRKDFGWLLGLLWLLPLAFFWYWLYPASWYATWYDTDTSRVHLWPEPHDCDFWKAPLGFKECHFQRRVVTEKNSNTGKVSVYVSWDKVDDN